MKSEAAVQSEIRLYAAEVGITLWRNNSGVFKDERGIPIRFGLANDSAKLNKEVKSADLIGVVPDGRFIAVECKREGWRWSGTKEEIAQERFLQIVREHAGVGFFCSSLESFKDMVKNFPGSF